MAHIPVLLNEVIKYLDPQDNDIVLDATIGEGGHAIPVAKKILPKGKLIGVEQDSEILRNLRFKVQDLGIKNINLVNGNFRNLDKLLNVNYIDAALFDLGINSSQLAESKRGFTFQKDEPLLMNFNPNIEEDDLTAEKILNRWPENEICEILTEYGEERYAKKISQNIIKFRKNRRFAGTFDLVGVIEKSVPVSYKKRRINFATKTFQALRIAVNDEMGALEDGLEKSWGLLRNKGRMVVISFHSLEDGIVKNFFRQKKEEKMGIVLTKKPIRPSEREKYLNPRSRSAKLRAIIKTNGDFYKN